jgi:hypothetical protein
MLPVAGKVSSAECTTLPVGSTRELRERDVLGLIPSTMAQRSRNTDRSAIESPSLNTHQVHGPVEQSKAAVLHPSESTTSIFRYILSQSRKGIRFQDGFGHCTKTELAMSTPSTSPSGRPRRKMRSPGNAPAERELIVVESKRFWRDARSQALENGVLDTTSFSCLVNA